MSTEPSSIRPIRVVYFQRKPRPGNFSVESLFDEVRRNLSSRFEAKVSIARFRSNGILRRLWIGLEAAARQRLGDVNHVTGDINFVTLFLDRRRTVLTVHDVGFLYRPESMARRFLEIFWLRWPVRIAAKVTAISETTRNEILKRVDCDPSKIVVVYDPLVEGLRSSIKPFDKERPTILQIGTKANKNVPRLAEALEGIPCRLDLVGPLSAELRAKLEVHRIDFTSSAGLSREELAARYDACDLVSFISIFEGFGMPIIEANSVGKPVVTSKLSSMPEIAGNAACLVDPFDVADMRRGLRRVIDDVAYREKLIANGFLNAKRFAPRAITAQFEAIYSEVAEDSGRS